MPRPKIVHTPHYHIWTDALHARALAHQANNRWDRGTYVRWTITTAWTALEMACEDALQTKGIGRSFRKNLDAAISKLGLTKIDWGSGTWQQIARLQKIRRDQIHVNPSEADLFPGVDSADYAILTIRDTIKDVYLRAGRTPPVWVEDQEDRGWDSGRDNVAHATAIRSGADQESPEAIKVGYIYKDREYITEVLPPGTDPAPIIRTLLQRIRIPISHVRAYAGQKLLVDREVPMRGVKSIWGQAHY